MDQAQKKAAQRAKVNFRCSYGYHLTYKTHIDHATLIKAFEDRCGGYKWYSVVHERGHGRESGVDSNGAVSVFGSGVSDAGGVSDVEEYDHTHFAFCHRSRLETTNARYFDIGGIHPHIRPLRGPAHQSEVYFTYHRKEPVLLTQSKETPSTGLHWTEVARNMPDLLTACTELGVRCRSVADVKLIRDSAACAGEYKHQFPGGRFWVGPVGSDGAPKQWRTLFLTGCSGAGKTQWALHQFANPLLVGSRDGLRGFIKGFHDGIVLDDPCHSDWVREDWIAFCDFEEDRDVRARYGNARIPARTRKIICTNLPWSTFMPVDPSGAIRRRVYVVQVTGALYQADDSSERNAKRVRYVSPEQCDLPDQVFVATSFTCYERHGSDVPGSDAVSAVDEAADEGHGVGDAEHDSQVSWAVTRSLSQSEEEYDWIL